MLKLNYRLNIQQTIIATGTKLGNSCRKVPVGSNFNNRNLI